MSSDEEKIKVVMILDVVGKPPKHLIESLEKIIEEIDKEKGVTVTAKEIKEPTTMKEREDFFTTFAELEIEVEEILYLAILLFKYMPAHLEIISPENIALTNNGLNDIFNELTRRLHGYDEITRLLQAEKSVLINKIQELTGKPIEEIFKRAEAPKEVTKKSKKTKIKKK